MVTTSGVPVGVETILCSVSFKWLYCIFFTILLLQVIKQHSVSITARMCMLIVQNIHVYAEYK
jgi:hypothetical protein